MLFPDGTRRPFDELVRSSLTCGQIKARRQLLHDGAAEHALKNGASRGTKWRGNRMDLDPYTCRLAWFEDPQGLRSRNPHCDSVHLDCTPCTVYVNRVDTTQLALSFGSQLLLLKAATQEEACDWATVLASAIFFSSESFKAVVDECAQCFAIAVSLRSEMLHAGTPDQGKDAQLSLDETAALLRIMFRPLGFNDIRVLESRLNPSGSGLGVEAFTHLFRHMASDDNPLDELARALTILSAAHSKTVPALDATPDLPLGDAMFEELKKQNIPTYIVNLLLDAADAVAYGASPEGPPQPVAPLQVAQVMYPRTAGLTAGDHFVFDHAETPIGYRAEPLNVSAAGSEAPDAADLEAIVLTEKKGGELAHDRAPGNLEDEIDAELRSMQPKKAPAEEPAPADPFVDQLRNMWGSMLGEAAEPEPASKDEEKVLNSDEEGAPAGPTPRTYEGRLARARSGKQGDRKGGDGSDERFFDSDETAEPDGPTLRTYAGRVDRARAGKRADGDAAGGSDEAFFDPEEQQAEQQAEPDGPTPSTYESRMDRARSGMAVKAADGTASDEKFFDSPEGGASPVYDDFDDRAMLGGTLRSRYIGADLAAQAAELRADKGPGPQAYQARLARARADRAEREGKRWDDADMAEIGPTAPTPRTYQGRLERARVRKIDSKSRTSDTSPDLATSPGVHVSLSGSLSTAGHTDDSTFVPVGGTLRSRYIGEDLASQAKELRTEKIGVTPRTYEARVKRARAGGRRSSVPVMVGPKMASTPMGGTLRSQYIGMELAAQIAERKTEPAITPRTYSGRIQQARDGLSAKDISAVTRLPPAAVEEQPEPAGEKTDAFHLTLPRANARVIGAMPVAKAPEAAPLMVARI